MYLDYSAQKEYVQKLGLKSIKEWKEYIKSDKFPNFLYKDPAKMRGFMGLPDFLGYLSRNNRVYLSFTEAHSYVLKLNLKSQKDWFKWYKINRPEFIPYSPEYSYKNEWISFGHWLGTNVIKDGWVNYYSYIECQEIIKKQNFKNRKSFNIWIKNINDIRIPRRPDHVYRNSGWINWYAFLNVIKPSPRNKKLITYNEAVEYLKDKNLQKYEDYVEYIKENSLYFLPLRPDYVYRDNWDGYVNYLSKSRSDRQSYGEMKIEEFLKKNKIEYIKEQKFETCKNISQLPFDFYLPKHNLCIEYDGELHYKSTKIFGGRKSLNRIKKHDEIKNNWCLNNDINLLRISYKKQSKIKDILNNILKIKLEKSEIY